MAAHTMFKGFSVCLVLAAFQSPSSLASAPMLVGGSAEPTLGLPTSQVGRHGLHDCGAPLLIAQQDSVQQGFVQQEAELQGQSQTKSSGGRFRLKRPGAEAPAASTSASASPASAGPASSAPVLPEVPAAVSAPAPGGLGNTESSLAPSTAATSSGAAAEGKVIWRPGIILSGTAGETALNPTCDLSLAASQASEFPDSAEAAFIHAVALTRSSQVEAALKEVRRARNLAGATGDPDYFNRAVSQYEQSLEADPNNSCVRYGLSWAYYMQAYLLGERARKQENLAKPVMPQMYRKKSRLGDNLLSGATMLASALTGTKPPVGAVPHIPGALEGAPAWAIPQIKQYYQKSINQLDQVIKREPTNAWAATYRVHVNEEYDGNNGAALSQLEGLKKRFPDNPAVAFFLADAYARNGNFAAGAGSLGRAVQLKLQGK